MMTGFVVSFALGAVSAVFLIWGILEVWWRFIA